MADLQSTNRTKLSKVREATFGVTPANPAFKAVRNTGSTIGAEPQTVTSEEIRSDRQVVDLILVGQQADGDVNGELSFYAMDDDIEEALQGSWQLNPVITVVTAGTEISALSATTATVSAGGAAFTAGMLVLAQGFPTASNNKKARLANSTATSLVFPASTWTAETATIPAGASMRSVGFQGTAGDIQAVANGLTSTALDFTTFGLVPGEWLKIGGALAAEQFATGADNDFARVVSIAAHAIVMDNLPSGWAADAGAGKTVSVFMGDFVRNGVNKVSNTFERQFLDHSPPTYEYLRGMTLDKLGLTFRQQQIVTLSKSYMGKDGSMGTVRASGATDISAPGYDVLNASASVGRVGYNGSVLTGPNFVTECTINIANNIRRQTAVGTPGAVGTGNGEFSVTGTLNTYFGDPSVAARVTTNQATSFDTRLVEAASPNKETLLIDLPRIKLSSGRPQVSGKNADVMLSPNYQAMLHPTLGYTMHVGRYWLLE